MRPFLRASLICGTAVLLGFSAFAQVTTPAAQGSNSPAASRPVSCTESLLLPLGISFQGSPTDPYSPEGSAATPYSAVEEISVVQTLAHGTAIPPRRSTAKIYRD